MGGEGIEPSTYDFSGRRSAAELPTHQTKLGVGLEPTATGHEPVMLPITPPRSNLYDGTEYINTN